MDAGRCGGCRREGVDDHAQAPEGIGKTARQRKESRFQTQEFLAKSDQKSRIKVCFLASLPRSPRVIWSTLLYARPPTVSKPPCMCIAVSWRAARVAKLSALFELGCLLLAWHLAAGDGRESLLPVAASLLSLGATGLLVFFGDVASRARKCALLCCGASVVLHLWWSISIDGARRLWKQGVAQVCASGVSSLMQSPQWESLLAMASTELNASEVVASTAAGIEEQLGAIAKMREAGLRPMGGMRRLEVRPFACWPHGWLFIHVASADVATLRGSPF